MTEKRDWFRMHEGQTGMSYNFDDENDTERTSTRSFKQKPDSKRSMKRDWSKVHDRQNGKSLKFDTSSESDTESTSTRSDNPVSSVPRELPNSTSSGSDNESTSVSSDNVVSSEVDEGQSRTLTQEMSVVPKKIECFQYLHECEELDWKPTKNQPKEWFIPGGMQKYREDMNEIYFRYWQEHGKDFSAPIPYAGPMEGPYSVCHNCNIVQWDCMCDVFEPPPSSPKRRNENRPKQFIFEDEQCGVPTSITDPLIIAEREKYRKEMNLKLFEVWYNENHGVDRTYV
jgi:hypothetical protein